MKKNVVMIMSVLMLIIALCGCGGGASSPEDAAENFATAALEVDLEAMIECMPPQISENFLEGVKNGKIDISGKEKEFRGQVPDEFECEIKRKVKMDTEEIEKYEERLMKDAEEIAEIVEVDFVDSELVIEEAYYVEYELTGDGDVDKEELPVGKIDGRWYVLTTDFDDAF